jgi:hypothetical protein
MADLGVMDTDVHLHRPVNLIIMFTFLFLVSLWLVQWIADIRFHMLPVTPCRSPNLVYIIIYPHDDKLPYVPVSLPMAVFPVCRCRLHKDNDLQRGNPLVY